MKKPSLYSQPKVNINVASVSDFSASNRYFSANFTGPQANLTAFTVWAVILPNTNATNQMIISKSNSISSTVGWSLGGGVGKYRFAVGNGSTAIVSPEIGYSEQEVGKISVIHAVIKDNEIFIYKNGVPVFGKTAIAAYATSNTGVSIGSYGGTTFFASGIIATGICSATGLSDTQVEAHYQEMLMDAYAIPTGATHLWKANTASTTWVDSISGLSAAITGTLVYTTGFYEFFNRYDYRYYISDSEPILPQIPNTAGLLKVMFIGDSRTVGVGLPNTNSFRDGVASLIEGSADLTNITFVGPNSSTARKPLHKGNSGWTSGNHIVGQGLQLPIDTTMDTYMPDICVVYLGTNASATDVLMSDERTNYMTLLRAIYNKNNAIRIVVMEETDHSNAINKAILEAHNNWFWKTAWPQLISEGIKLVRVKMYTTIKRSDGDYLDTVHPNAAGYAKMVPSLYAAIRLAAGYAA